MMAVVILEQFPIFTMLKEISKQKQEIATTIEKVQNARIKRDKGVYPGTTISKKGKKVEALAAYKAGIRAHIELMGLNANDYLNSTSVIQNSGDLTLSHIMIQKYIALSYSPELFSDMRRMNFCTDGSGVYNEAVGIYKGFKRPGHVFTQEYPEANKWPRRFAVASYSINYNIEQVLKQDPDATSIGYLSKPVFWDK